MAQTTQDQNISSLFSVVAPGQKSEQVKALQTALIGAGHKIDAGATGFFGPQTQAAVDAWKSAMGGTAPVIPSSTDGNAPGSTPFNLKMPEEPSSDLLKSYTNFDDIKKMLDENTASVNKTLVPTDNETKLKTQLADIQASEANINQGFKQYKNNLEGEGISTGAISGRSFEADRNAAFQLEPLALQEKNLLTRLGLEADARAIDQKIAEGKLQSTKDLVTTAFQIQDKIDQKKTALLNATDKMTDNTRQALSTILSQFKGLDFHSLSTAAQLKMQNMANQLGIPIDVVIQGMQVNKDQMDLDNLQKAKELKLRQQTEARLSADGGGAGLNKDEQAFQKDLNAGISKLAENSGNWGQVYDTLAGIYGRTNPELVKRLSPAEITAAGGDPGVDQSYLDIMLNKKKYNPTYNPQ